jgi:hypothetical protein
MKQRISGKQAARVAEDMAKRGPLVPSEKPSSHCDQCLAPAPNLEDAKTTAIRVRQDHVVTAITS